MKRRWTLCEWLEEWFEVYKKPNLSANSLRNIGQVLRLYIPDELKGRKLTDILSVHMGWKIERCCFSIASGVGRTGNISGKSARKR